MVHSIRKRSYHDTVKEADDESDVEDDEPASNEKVVKRICELREMYTDLNRYARFQESVVGGFYFEKNELRSKWPEQCKFYDERLKDIRHAYPGSEHDHYLRGVIHGNLMMLRLFNGYLGKTVTCLEENGKYRRSSREEEISCTEEDVEFTIEGEHTDCDGLL